MIATGIWLFGGASAFILNLIAQKSLLFLRVGQPVPKPTNDDLLRKLECPKDAKAVDEGEGEEKEKENPPHHD